MIVGVVVKKGDLTVCLPKPNRHHDCIHFGVLELELEPPIGHEGQGFYTDEGVFLNRKDALVYAKEHNQLINPLAKGELFSEDLW